MQHHFTSQELEHETWKPVIGFEDLYEVSSLGRVKRIAPSQGTRPGYIQSPRVAKDGYPRVSLRNKGVENQLAKLHQVVAAAFLGPKPSLLHEINHKDGDKTNCSQNNLEWVTRGTNLKHAYRIGLKISNLVGESNWSAKLTETKVLEIRASLETDKELANRFQVSPITIYQIRKGWLWKHLL